MHNATTMTLEARITEAAARGTRAGKAAASWVFDGNTTDETYRATLQGIEDGDPAVMGGLSWEPLSGQWAGESITELLGDLIAWRAVITEGAADDEEEADDEEWEALTDAYEEAAQTAYWDGIEATCRLHLEG